MKFSLRHILALLLFQSGLLTGCADPHFLDKTKKDSSVIQGEAVAESDIMAHNVVFIGHNFDQSTGEPEYFGLCTGVILHPRLILTAAHCAENYKTSKVITTVNAKKLQILNENIYSIIDATTHQKYLPPKSVRPNPNYDLALLKLDRPLITQSNNVTLGTIDSSEVLQKTKLKISLNTTENKGLILGYGRTTALLDPTQAESTQKKETPRQLNGELNFAFIDLQSSDLSAALFSVPQHDKPGVCSGDSGGPLYLLENGIYKLKAIAISVFKNVEESQTIDQINNACNYNSLFLNLDFQQEWIRKEMQKLLQ